MGWMLRDVGSERTFRLFAIVLFALLAGLNYFPALIGKIPFPRDLVLQFPAWKEVARSEPLQRYADIGDLVTLVYPFRSFAASAVRSGTLPLWNPHFQSGAPFQADPQSALFYPPNFFYYVLPTPIAWAVCLFVRMVLAGFLTTLFVREIGGTKAGSIFSGIVFASCGFITAWQGQCIGDASIWLPLVGYAVHRLHRDRTNFSVALAGIAFAMPVLAGHPETALHVTLAGLLMAAFWWAASIRPRARYFNAGFLLSFALAGLLDNSETTTISKIPGLGDIPVLGNLFRSKSFQKNESELMFIVTAQVVKPVNRDDLPKMPNVENLKKASLLGVDRKEDQINGPSGFITKPGATSNIQDQPQPVPAAKPASPPVKEATGTAGVETKVAAQSNSTIEVAAPVAKSEIVSKP